MIKMTSIFYTIETVHVLSSLSNVAFEFASNGSHVVAEGEKKIRSILKTS